MFAKAIKEKVRFESPRGNISTEDLWDLPLVELDRMYRALNKQVKETQEGSLLDTASRGITTLELKVEIIRYVVTARLEEKEEAKVKPERKSKKEHLLRI